MKWMLTAHSTLRDRYTRRSSLLTLAVMALSIVGLMLALANGDQQVRVLGLEGKLQVFLGGLAAVTFLVSLVDLVVDWRRRAWAHGDAARRLGELSSLYARAVAENGRWIVEGVDLTVEYDRAMSSIVPIPDKKAAALKALHNRKEEVFRRADRKRGAPAWLLRLEVLIDGVFGRLPSEESPKSQEVGK